MMMMMVTMSFAMSFDKNFVQDQLSILECFFLVVSVVSKKKNCCNIVKNKMTQPFSF